eukprot:UN10741
MLKRVEYSSRELEQLKLLDAAIDDEDDILDSDSLHFPENDNMELTDEYVSVEEANSIILNIKQNAHEIAANQAQKSIFENDTDREDDHIDKLVLVTKQLNVNSNTISNANNNGE